MSEIKHMVSLELNFTVHAAHWRGIDDLGKILEYNVAMWRLYLQQRRSL
jgi:hypothetical protein